MRATARAALTAAVLAAAGCGAASGVRLIDDPRPVFRGHRDVAITSGQAVPWVIGRASSVGLCIEAPQGADTSPWEVRLFDEPPARAAARLGGTLCFETRMPASWADGEHELCARLTDRFDGTAQALPCVAFRFDADEGVIRGLESRIAGAISGGESVLGRLASDADAAGYPALAFRTRLIRAYTLRREGTPAARAEAARLLGEAPAWVALPAGARWAAQRDYERGMLSLESQGDLAESWRLLASAESGFRAGIDRKWIAAVGKQAEILSRAGDLGEAKRRLRNALAACEAAPCDAALARATRTTWSWLVATDPDAADEELGSARHDVESLEPVADKLEEANVVLNEAFLDLRLGDDPSDALERARGLIGSATSARARELSGWADLVAARRELRGGDSLRAASAGDRLADHAESDRLRAFGASCAAAARRRLGDLQGARRSLDVALTLHASAARDEESVSGVLGPGPRAEDAYAMARIDVERGDAAAAWRILAALDSDAARDVSYRAFPLEDEIIVLRQTSGSIDTYRRTPLDRRELNHAVGALRDAVDRGESSDATWRGLSARLSEALAPRPADCGSVTTFALHGILQEVPLAALTSGGRWLADVTTVVTHAAGAGGMRVSSHGATATVVVSDPEENLGLPEPAARAATRVLRGAAATPSALRDALRGATRLHVDAHARYEPAFPELSTIALAGGAVTGRQLADWASTLELADLSGCQTGRSPISADSGRFGIAGLLARRGVAWVVGTRAPLDNGLAKEFNASFRAALDAGDTVPSAFHGAIDRVRLRYPASRWATLLLLHAEPTGQSVDSGTPSLSRTM